MAKYLVSVKISKILEFGSATEATEWGQTFAISHPLTEADDSVTVEFEKIRDDFNDPFIKGSVGCSASTLAQFEKDK